MIKKLSDMSNDEVYEFAHELLGLCNRALLALQEDEFPQLRQELREAIKKGEDE